jgi:hypothetical protein
MTKMYEEYMNWAIYSHLSVRRERIKAKFSQYIANDIGISKK